MWLFLFHSRLFLVAIFCVLLRSTMFSPFPDRQQGHYWHFFRCFIFSSVIKKAQSVYKKQLGHHAHNKYHYKYIHHPALHKYLIMLKVNNFSTQEVNLNTVLVLGMLQAKRLGFSRFSAYIMYRIHIKRRKEICLRMKVAFSFKYSLMSTNVCYRWGMAMTFYIFITFHMNKLFLKRGFYLLRNLSTACHVFVSYCAFEWKK